MHTHPLEPRRLLSLSLPDADASGTVDLADFSRLAASFNQPHSTRTEGDFDGSGTVDLTDFTILAANFNKSVTFVPKVITQGGTYSGYFSHVSVNTTQPVTLLDDEVNNPNGAAIDIAAGANVTVRGVLATAKGYFIDSEGAASLDVENCSVVGTAGMGVYNSPHGVVILRNTFEDLKGAPGTDHDQTHIILDSCANAEIAFNRIINHPGASSVEDNINCYKSSWVSIHDNYVQGAYPTDLTSADFSGGGIIADLSSSHISITRNVVVNCANYSVAISSGNNNALTDNLVVVTDTRPANANSALYIWNSYHLSDWSNNGGTGNRVYTASGNNWWTPDAAFWTNNTHLPATTAAWAYGQWVSGLGGAKVGA